MFLSPYLLPPEQLALLQLSFTEGLGPTTIRGLIEAMGSATLVLQASPKELMEKTNARPKLIHQIKDSKSAELAEDELARLRSLASNGVEVKLLFWGDEDYPLSLAQCFDAPIVLYIRGNIPLSPMISVVGTRKCTAYSGEVLRYIIKGLSELRPDVTIVSGLAYGVDKIAHETALQYGLKSIGIIAHGFYTLYPATHRELANKMISSGGGLITEYPYYTRALPQRFIQRNRIVAGLSLATIVAESPVKGGALVTANISFDYGRSVYAVPGRLFDETSMGCNQLIAKQKASIVTSPDDLLRDIGLLDEILIQKPLPFTEDTEEDNNPILKVLRETDELTIEDLSLRLGEEMSTLSSELFDLELDGKILSLPGGRYRIRHY